MAGALLKYNGSSLQTPSGAMGINNLVPENVKSGVNIGGVVGTLASAIFGSTSVSANTQTLTITDVPFEPKTFIIANKQASITYPMVNNCIYNQEQNLKGYSYMNIASGGPKWETPYMDFVYDGENNTLTISISGGTNKGQFIKNMTYYYIIA